MKNNHQRLLFQLVSSIPPGKVAAYGQLARLAGLKNPRYVGYLLHHNPDPETIPCHRVVTGRGQLAKNYAFGGQKAQKRKLLNEKVIFQKETVDLAQCLWNPYPPSSS